MLRESILTSIKKLLGISEEDESYDQDIIMLINSEFLPLTQIGVGPTEGFSINDKYAIWGEFVNDELLANSLNTYVYLKVRLVFDPPTSSTMADSIQRVVDQLEWRIQYRVENPNS